MQNELAQERAKKLVDIIHTGRHKNFHLTLVHLLSHHQVNLVKSLFLDPEFGMQLIEQFGPVYYATLLLTSKDNSILLKIPPEIKEIVNGIVSSVKEGQGFYYEKGKKQEFG